MVNKLSQKKEATNHILVLKEKDGQALSPFFNAMDALAKGVSAKLDLLTVAQQPLFKEPLISPSSLIYRKKKFRVGRLIISRRPVAGTTLTCKK